MITRSKLLYALSIIVVFALFGCNDITRNEKFDKTKWAHYDELYGPDRDLMGEYLVKTHKLIGLTYRQMLQLLGAPANYTGTTNTYYKLATEFDGTEPVSEKNLNIQFNKDSVIISVEIKEWHYH